MEAGSLDGDSAACSLEAAGSLDAAGDGSFGVLVAWMLEALRLAAWMVTLQPAAWRQLAAWMLLAMEALERWQAGCWWR